MKLTIENIDKWLEILDRQSNYIFGREMSSTLTKEMWIDLWADHHVIDFIHEEIEAAI